MQIDELVPLTNGLSVTACGQTLVCDRTRVIPAAGDAVDMKFLIAGTDFVPRFRLSRQRISRATSDEVATIVRRVVRGAIGCRQAD